MVSRGSTSKDIKEILENLNDSTILQRYFGLSDKRLPIKINSPYRKDENPSLSFYANKDGKIKFKDFGTGENGSLIDLLAKIWGVTFKDAAVKIYSDLQDAIEVTSTTNKKISRPKNSLTAIKVKTRSWQDWDIAYWESYGISLPWLKFGDVYPVSKIFYIRGKETIVINAEKYAYCYVEGKDNNVSIKVYQPFSKKYKWSSKHDSSVWDLWAKLPEKGDKLIITSSRKDALTLWENTGIPSVSMQGEGYLPKPHVMNQLLERFTKVYILYDNDFDSEQNWGRIDGNKIASAYNIKQIEIPEEYHSKDPSDLVRNYNRETLRNVIRSLIKDDTE